VPLLAALPFDNLSHEPAMEFFPDGVSDEILQTVARTTGVSVIGRSSLQLVAPVRLPVHRNRNWSATEDRQ
jgi:TolB-like protein